MTKPKPRKKAKFPVRTIPELEAQLSKQAIDAGVLRNRIHALDEQLARATQRATDLDLKLRCESPMQNVQTPGYRDRCRYARMVSAALNLAAVVVIGFIVGIHTHGWMGWATFLGVGALMPSTPHFPGCDCSVA